MTSQKEMTFQKLKMMLKPLILKEIIEAYRHPLTGINNGGFVCKPIPGHIKNKLDHREVKLDIEKLEVMKSQASKILVANIYEEKTQTQPCIVKDISGDYSLIEGVDDYSFSHGRIIECSLDRINKTEKFTNEELKKINISLWDCLVFESMQNMIGGFAKAKAEILADKFKVGFGMHEIPEILAEAENLVMDYFIIPRVYAIKDDTQGQLDIAFNSATAVFDASWSKINSGKLSDKELSAVYALVDETANALAGNFSVSAYDDALNSLPSDDRDWAPLIGFGLIFAGVMLLAAAVALAIFTSGASAPASIIAGKVAVETIIAGLAIASVVFTAAGVLSMFAIPKPIELKKTAIAFKAEQDEKTKNLTTYCSNQGAS